MVYDNVIGEAAVEAKGKKEVFFFFNNYINGKVDDEAKKNKLMTLMLLSFKELENSWKFWSCVW